MFISFFSPIFLFPPRLTTARLMDDSLFWFVGLYILFIFLSLSLCNFVLFSHPMVSELEMYTDLLSQFHIPRARSLSPSNTTVCLYSANTPTKRDISRFGPLSSGVGSVECQSIQLQVLWFLPHPFPARYPLFLFSFLSLTYVSSFFFWFHGALINLTVGVRRVYSPETVLSTKIRKETRDSTALLCLPVRVLHAQRIMWELKFSHMFVVFS